MDVAGTLADQMTYPDENAGKLSREDLFDVLDQVRGQLCSSVQYRDQLTCYSLRQVDLTYLLDREGVLDSEINWEDACSLGEKQRLAIARLIWHKPQFA